MTLEPATLVGAGGRLGSTGLPFYITPLARQSYFFSGFSGFQEQMFPEMLSGSPQPSGSPPPFPSAG